MSTIVTDNKHYSDIANAIRAKNETNTTYKPSEMALAIRAIESGGIPCTLTVETSAGAVITATLGNTTVSATANANGIATLILKKEGTWNITGTLNGSTKSTTVEVYHEIAEEIELANKFYINFLGNIYEYEFESGMTWNDFLLSDYNNDPGFEVSDVKLAYDISPEVTIENVLCFYGAPILTEELNKAKVDPYIFCLPLASDSPNYSPVSGKTYIVHIDTLENVPWVTVSAISRAGKASQYWSVGDTKSFDCGSDTYTAQIIGFDHDDVTDSASYGRTKAGTTFQFEQLYKTNYKFNSSSSVSRFDSATIYKTSIPTIQDELANDLSRVLVGVSKKCLNASDSKIYTITDQKFTLPAYVEMLGNNANGITTNEKKEGTQYAFYAAGNSATKAKLGSTSDSYWYTRTLYTTARARVITTSGSGSTISVTTAYSVAPIFFV